jgi:hypothetical protein
MGYAIYWTQQVVQYTALVNASLWHKHCESCNKLYDDLLLLEFGISDFTDRRHYHSHAEEHYIFRLPNKSGESHR